MTFEASFLDLMAETVTYKPYASVGGFGKPSFGTTIDLRCHITRTKKIVRGNNEENVTSTAQLQMPPPGYVLGAVTYPTITTADRLILPGGDERRVLNVVVRYDETGVHHQSVALT